MAVSFLSNKLETAPDVIYTNADIYMKGNRIGACVKRLILLT